MRGDHGDSEAAIVRAASAGIFGVVSGVHPLAALIGGYGVLLSETFLAERRARAADVVRATQELVSEEELRSALESSASLREAAREALLAGANTDWEPKRVLLGRAVARAAQDDARVDKERLLIRAAAACEPFEAKLLAIVGSPAPQSARHLGWTLDELKDRGYDDADLDAGMAVLVNLGLSARPSAGTDSSSRWWIVQFGIAFLDWLCEAEDSVAVPESERVTEVRW